MDGIRETTGGRAAPPASADLLDLIGGMADAVFATDEAGRIVIWNRAAAELLGRLPARVLGRPCHAVVCGTDIFGNRYCDEDCPLMRMVRRRQAVHGFEMLVRTEASEEVRVGVSVLVVPGARPSRYTLVHLLQPIDRGPEVEDLIRRILAVGPAPPAALGQGLPPPPAQLRALTPRELEILRLLADGTGTREIADSLFISRATVRNHIQNILRKLEVHSMLQAVSLALRYGFI